jgi:hypothetical protein
MLLMAAGSDDTRQARAEARADLIRRLFAVAISVGFAATLARMSWVQNGTRPNSIRRSSSGPHCWQPFWAGTVLCWR